MCDTHVPEIMHGEHELMPECAQREGRREEPAVLVRDVGSRCKAGVTQDFRAVASNVAALVESSVDNAPMQFFIRLGVRGLCRRRQSGRWRLEDVRRRPSTQERIVILYEQNLRIDMMFVLFVFGIDVRRISVLSSAQSTFRRRLSNPAIVYRRKQRLPSFRPETHAPNRESVQLLQRRTSMECFDFVRRISTNVVKDWKGTY